MPSPTSRITFLGFDALIWPASRAVLSCADYITVMSGASFFFFKKKKKKKKKKRDAGGPPPDRCDRSVNALAPRGQRLLKLAAAREQVQDLTRRERVGGQHTRHDLALADLALGCRGRRARSSERRIASR